VLDAATQSSREKHDVRGALIAQAAEFVISDEFGGL